MTDYHIAFIGRPGDKVIHYRHVFATSEEEACDILREKYGDLVVFFGIEDCGSSTT